MDVERRIKTILLLEKINRKESYCHSIGIYCNKKQENTHEQGKNHRN